jgi:hypothetical protein
MRITFNAGENMFVLEAFRSGSSPVASAAVPPSRMKPGARVLLPAGKPIFATNGLVSSDASCRRISRNALPRAPLRNLETRHSAYRPSIVWRVRSTSADISSITRSEAFFVSRIS